MGGPVEDGGVVEGGEDGDGGRGEDRGAAVCVSLWGMYRDMKMLTKGERRTGS